MKVPFMALFILESKGCSEPRSVSRGMTAQTGSHLGDETQARFLAEYPAEGSVAAAHEEHRQAVSALC